jgi:hypothetical protein
MIVLEPGPPVVRPGEAEMAGRRIAARAVPYDGEVGPPAFRFDPILRTIVRRPADGRVQAGPADPEAWRAAIQRAPAGPVLVGPASTAEAVRGAYAAAAEGARASGRAVYLLDPDPEFLPVSAAEAFVALFAGAPDEPMWARLEACARRFPAGVLLPILPGWTAEEDFLGRVAARAADAGARFVAGIPVTADGDSRRRVVAARAAVEPESEDAYFDRVHHGDWNGETAKALARLEEAVRARGLAARPPRPRGEAEPAANAVAAARIEELADAEAANEHRAALLRAAVRWLDERSRDLAPVVAEGNFRKIFPFGGEIAPEVERALEAVP